MAAFGEQFDRVDPLTAKFDAPSESWHRRIAFEARTVLGVEARANLKRIAYTIDAVIALRAAELVKPVRSNGGPVSVAREAKESAKELVRQVHGDLAILEAARGANEVVQLLQTAHSSIDVADLYAVFALWKLADYVESLRRPPKPNDHVLFAWAKVDGQGRSTTADIRARISDALLAQAAHASASAWRLRQEALRSAGAIPQQQAERLTADLRDLVVKELKGRVSERNRAAIEVRHSRPGGSRDKQAAIRAVWASGKYDSRDRCAEEECAALGISFATARKALRNTPDPT